MTDSPASGTPPALRQRLIEILRDVLQVEIDPGLAVLRRQDVDGWDSVNHLRLILELEQEFEVALEDEEIATVESLADLEAILTRHGVGQA